MTPARRSGRNQVVGRKPTTRSLTLPQQRAELAPVSPPPADTPSAAEDEEEDEEDEEVEESSDGGSVTRCLCGEQHNVGLMVQCDKCEVWQHCDCVGLTEQQMPELYYCDHCQPDNHIVYKAHGRARYRRAYNPNGSARNSTDSSAHSSAPTKHNDDDDAADTRATKRRKRDTHSPRRPPAASSIPTAITTAIAATNNNNNKRKQPAAAAAAAAAAVVAVAAPMPTRTHAKPDNSDDGDMDDDKEQPALGEDSDDKRPRRKSNDEQDARVREEGVSRGRKQAKSGGRRNQHGSPQRQINNGKHKDSPRLATPLLTDDLPAPATPQLYWDDDGQPAREPSPPAKVKYPSPKMSMADMNKRAKQIMDYVNKLQMDLSTKKEASTRRARSDSTCSSSSTLSSASTLPLNDDDDDDDVLPVVNKYALGALTSPTTPIPVVAVQQESAMDIINHITRDLVHFQRKFGSSYTMVSSSPRAKKLAPKNL